MTKSEAKGILFLAGLVVLAFLFKVFAYEHLLAMMK